MSQSHSAIDGLWRQIRARPRLLLSAAAGLLAFALLPSSFASSTRVLLTWDVGAGLYLALAWMMIGRATVEHMRWRAKVQDDGAAVVLFLTVAAATASLAAIVMELSGLKSLPPAEQGFHVGLVAVTFAASWLLVHTAFALHYAHVYYSSPGQEGGAPLEFPRQETPGYVDFLYFSAVVGMTAQTADVAVATTRMRRLVMAHGVIAFVFNTTLLALTINIAAGLLG
jgi:uncharacterized membrane protein